MAIFFEPFPKIEYDINKNGQPITATNIMLRFKIRDIVLKYTELLFEYTVRDGEKPFMVAQKYYKRPELSELILLTNFCIDPYFDWPLSTREFDDYLEKKYGSVPAATQKVYAYYQIIQPRTVNIDGTIITERTLRVDHTTYLSLVDENRKLVYCYDYEHDLNESKRHISLIKKNFIPQIEAELKTILK